MKLNNLKRKLISVATAALIFSSTAPAVNVSAEEYWPEGPAVQSNAAIVMDVDTGTILYEKNINDVHYPASITKIMTTLLAIENSDLSEVVTFSQDAVYNTEGSGIARDVGEEMTMEQCLYAVMLESANECAYAVGEHVAGDITSFVNMMNERATELGCLNTHFNNSNGLPDEAHYTSAYDMALIAREAFKNETFRVICGTKTYTIPFTNKHTDEETYLRNHHQMLYPLKTSAYLYDYCLGGKTGYTTAANSTLVTYAEKDGMTLVCVVLDATSPAHYEDTTALFDFCFANFHIVDVADNVSTNDISTTHITENESFVSVDSSAKIILPIAANYEDATSEVVYDEENEDVLASISYTYAGHNVGEADIVTTGATITQFQFESDVNDTETDEDETESETSTKRRVTLNGSTILKVVAVIVILGIIIFVIIKIVNSVGFRKYISKNQGKNRYKTIKPNKKWNKRQK
ncbi:MAG: D-alanyl-D-alanine carboxypeptidase [Lachnospiraceae bacterium]|nr:D-alanyl-D-alanine carboxypeptidase [Lachnospiraceae bacterium]